MYWLPVLFFLLLRKERDGEEHLLYRAHKKNPPVCCNLESEVVKKMAFRSKKKDKKSGTLVKSTVACFKALDKCDNKSKQEKLGSEGSAFVHAIKEVFYPESRLEPNTEAGDILAGEILASEILPLVFTHLEVLTFEVIIFFSNHYSFVCYCVGGYFSVLIFALCRLAKT